MKRIKAIPTKYCGVRFRSRTEAKYTALFNMFDEPWTYESEYFKLSKNYLPDFYLPRLGVWVEIKGKEPTKQEARLCAELSLVTKKDVLIAYGWPPPSNPFKPGLWLFSNGKFRATGLYWLYDSATQKPVIEGPGPASYQSIDEKIFENLDKKFRKPFGSQR